MDLLRVWMLGICCRGKTADRFGLCGETCSSRARRLERFAEDLADTNISETSRLDFSKHIDCHSGCSFTISSVRCIYLVTVKHIALQMSALLKYECDAVRHWLLSPGCVLYCRRPITTAT